ncbi:MULTISPECIES: M1 family metallopeptidase [Olivibacter]|uniref:M1 family metallopeptidase n=2 Tax=Olivibacter TaxID=376469 RepID=A0ABV6HQ17_9SPHI|nr:MULTISPECIES: M1 family metallopeptidase [Olivibacter]MCL4640256.1 M1 family metallopeptidase [Olivibacter sp. UJ_SKK_5.1]MDM8173850.1 M1 family metallopeptidase [Olivibacter sp. 47]QEL03640.1 M1 family peptidase [Olivibacter sp. LS-1]
MLKQQPFIALIAFILTIGTSFGQTVPAPSKYDYEKAFAPIFYTQNGNEYRSASGKPGVKYWQNRVNYTIKVRLNEERKEIEGVVYLDYTNNSPDRLDFLWLQLDQNLFSKKSRGAQIVPVGKSRYGSHDTPFDGGYTIEAVKGADGKSIAYQVNDTRMQVFLPEALDATGGNTKLAIHYRYTIPDYGADRTGILQTAHGDIFAIAQWYPRMAVYDDVLGWNVQPYTGPGEFYLEYGDFNVEITAPSKHIVVCGGELLNPDEVYTEEQLKRWEKAKKSDKTVMIRSGEEVTNPTSRPQGKKELTWRFRLNRSRDIAWASSSSFIIDAAKINLPNGQTSMAVSAYPMESNGNNAWERSTEYTKSSIEYYSSKWYPYPYPIAVNVASNIGGMEYPGIVFCRSTAKASSLWGVTDHEFGHIWFPMIVGSNERLYAWMDEGFNSFINTLSKEAFNNGEYRTAKYNGHDLARVYFSDDVEPIMSSPQNMKESNIGTLAYRKPQLALTILREHILGEERFDRAFKTYIDYWAYKHPTPFDFFRTIENVAGENLSWFWRSWFQYNWKLDQAVEGVKYVENDPAKGAIITVSNLEEMPMPLIVEIVSANGNKQRIKLPVEIWERNQTFSFKVATNERLKSVVIDPDKVFPDINPANNNWTDVQ